MNSIPFTVITCIQTFKMSQLKKNASYLKLEWSWVVTSVLPAVIKYSPEAEIYVVDNASTDESVEEVKTNFHP